MIFPLVWDNILEYLLIDWTATDVDREVFSLMLNFEKLSDGINIVPIKLLDARSRESHSNDPRRDVGEVQIIPLLTIPVFRTANYLSQKVHRLSEYKLFIAQSQNLENSSSIPYSLQ